MSRGDGRALQRAAEALDRDFALSHSATDLPKKALLSEVTFQQVAECAVTAFLDALLSDLPEEAVEAASAAAFWRDDLGGHIEGRWTWETIPDEGRENYRQMVREAATAFLLSLRSSSRGANR